jgi:hypothetical protein
MKILQVNHSNLSNRACSRQVGFAAFLVNVRHDLRRDDFDWAVRLFNQIGNAESSVGAGVWGAIG